MEILLNIIAQSARISIPYILAAIGGTFSERSGIVNIGLEGIMLSGAFCSVIGVYYTGNPWLGVFAGILGGIIIAMIHAVTCIEYKADHIVSGIAVNLFAVGMTEFLLILVFNSSSNSERIDTIDSVGLPFIGEINPIMIITVLIVVVSHIILFYTKFGLRLRSSGENPRAADTLGIKVRLFRYSGVIISGALAGLAGAWLTMEQSQFTAGMSNGRGFIALAAMIFGKWTPLGAAGAALVFGFAESIQIQLQIHGLQIPTQFVQMIPYILTIIVLAGFIGKTEPPEADGVPYPKEIL